MTEMWLLKYCLIRITEENFVEKGEIAQFEQFHLFAQCFPKAFFFLQCVKMSIYGGKGLLYLRDIRQRITKLWNHEIDFID